MTARTVRAAEGGSAAAATVVVELAADTADRTPAGRTELDSGTVVAASAAAATEPGPQGPADIAEPAEAGLPTAAEAGVAQTGKNLVAAGMSHEKTTLGQTAHSFG